jgi:hypothetical protein
MLFPFASLILSRSPRRPLDDSGLKTPGQIIFIINSDLDRNQISLKMLNKNLSGFGGKLSSVCNFGLAPPRAQFLYVYSSVGLDSRLEYWRSYPHMARLIHCSIQSQPHKI